MEIKRNVKLLSQSLLKPSMKRISYIFNALSALASLRDIF
jgi:hypothetical protein